MNIIDIQHKIFLSLMVLHKQLDLSHILLVFVFSLFNRSLGMNRSCNLLFIKFKNLIIIFINH